MNYNTYLKNKEIELTRLNKEAYTVKWLFLNSKFFVGYSKLSEEVDPKIIKKLERMLSLYVNDNVPPQYILHKAFFYNYEFYVDENCFIPRPETEELVEQIIYYYDDFYSHLKHIDIADVCAGSGIIGITLKKEIPSSKVSMYELSTGAIAIEHKNARKNKARLTIVQGDFIKPILEKGKKFNIFVCNPPYIKANEILDPMVVDHEPNMALFGGNDGLTFYRILFENFNKLIKKNGLMALEIGYDLKKPLTKLLKEYKLHNLQYSFKKDYNKKDRMLFIFNKE